MGQERRLDAIDDSQQTETLRLDVDLVLINATVTNQQNRAVRGLEREHFRVFEDRVEQEVVHFSTEEVPMTVGVIFDVSGSMKDRMPVAQRAYTTFLRSGSAADEYFLVPFSDQPLLASDFSTDISRLQSSLMFVEARGMTAMYDAVYYGLSQLRDASNPKKALLLITDGEDNRSRYTFSNVREYVREQDVQIYTIGIVNDWNSGLNAGRAPRALLEELSEMTGARAFFPNSVYELEDIALRIAAELKNQYVLGYRSTNAAKDGAYRRVQVRLETPRNLGNLNVRAKGGYLAPAGLGGGN